MSAGPGVDHIFELVTGDIGIAWRFTARQRVAGSAEDVINPARMQRDKLQLSVLEQSRIDKLERLNRHDPLS
jgi:hypothetical protein